MGTGLCYVSHKRFMLNINLIYISTFLIVIMEVDIVHFFFISLNENFGRALKNDDV